MLNVQQDYSTVQSYIFTPNSNELWVAFSHQDGDISTFTPATERTYYHFNFADLFLMQ